MYICMNTLRTTLNYVQCFDIYTVYISIPCWVSPFMLLYQFLYTPLILSARVISEVRQLFRSGGSSQVPANADTTPASESLLSNGSDFTSMQIGKEIQKGLVVIDFQGEDASEVAPLREYEKLYDGCMRFRSDMKELEIRRLGKRSVG